MAAAKKNPSKKKQAKDAKNEAILTSDTKCDTKEIETTVQQVDSEPPSPRILLPFDGVPEWCRDNRFVTHGYRPITNSFLTCYESWFYFHNETINIFSHLVPSILALFILTSLNTIFGIKYPKADYVDYLVLTLFFVTAVICLGTSATYHTLICHSQKVEAVWLRLDFVGIIVLMMGIFISAIMFGFKCHVAEQRIYCSMITVLGLLSIMILVSPRFQGLKWRTFRTLTFVGTGLSGFAPIIHGIILFGFQNMLIHRGMAYWLAEGLVFLLGAFFYITRIPESIAPGRFNIFGSSHQIFHSLVVVACGIHLVGILEVFKYNYPRPCHLES